MCGWASNWINRAKMNVGIERKMPQGRQSSNQSVSLSVLLATVVLIKDLVPGTCLFVILWFPLLVTSAWLARHRFACSLVNFSFTSKARCCCWCGELNKLKASRLLPNIRAIIATKVKLILRTIYIFAVRLLIFKCRVHHFRVVAVAGVVPSAGIQIRMVACKIWQECKALQFWNLPSSRGVSRSNECKIISREGKN